MRFITATLGTAFLGLQLLPASAIRFPTEHIDYQKRGEQTGNPQVEKQNEQVGDSSPDDILGKHGRLSARQATSTSMIGMNTTFASRSTQVPIATVCPAGVSATQGTNSTKLALASLPKELLVDVAGSIVTASATLPGGMTTAFSSLAKIGVEALPNANGLDMARLVVGPDGCQTLYAPTTTTVCSTVITPFGLPPVSITDCEQYVTFSSETMFSCIATPTVTPLPASSVTTTTNSLANIASRGQASAEAGFDAGGVNNDETDDEVSTHTLVPPTARSFSVTGKPRLHSYSAAAGMPMSLPRQMVRPLAQKKMEKRQVLMSSGLDRPILTDLATVAPNSPLPTVATEVIPNPTALTAKYKRDSIHLGRSANATNETGNATSDTNQMLIANNADLAQLSPPSPTKYYAALWSEVLYGRAPLQVRGIVCSGGLVPSAPFETPQPDSDGDTEDGECITYYEAWTVTSLTRTRVGTTEVSFNGPAVLTYGGTTRTTTIQFTQAITTTVTEPYQSMVHITLGTLTNELAAIPTVTDVRTIPGPTRTFSLLSILPSTISTPTPVLGISVDMSSQAHKNIAVGLEGGTFISTTHEPMATSPIFITVLPCSTTTHPSSAINTADTFTHSTLASASTATVTPSLPMSTLPNSPQSSTPTPPSNTSQNPSSTNSTDDLATTVTEHSVIATETVTVSASL